MDDLQRCKMIANKNHLTQSYDIFPYMYHVEMVIDIAIEFGFDKAIQCGAALHDCIEDGSLSYSDIKKYISEEVAELVYAVSDELGRNRKEKKAKTYPKIRANWKAVALKLCDRLANMRHSFQYSPDKMSMYKKEHEAFKIALYNPDHPQNELAKLWNAIEQLLNSSN